MPCIGRTLALNLVRQVLLAAQGLYILFYLFFPSFFASISQLLGNYFSTSSIFSLDFFAVVCFSGSLLKVTRPSWLTKSNHKSHIPTRFWKHTKWIPSSFESTSISTKYQMSPAEETVRIPFSGESDHGSLSLHYCYWFPAPTSCESCGPQSPDLLKTWFLCCVRLLKAPKNGPVLTAFKGKTDFGPSPSRFLHINNIKTVFQSITVKIMLSSKHLTANSVLTGRLTALGLASIQN